MRHHPEILTRRKFLQLMGLTGLAGALPHQLYHFPARTDQWPRLEVQQLPHQMRAILPLVPLLAVDQFGYLTYSAVRSPKIQRLPVAQTQWNLAHSHAWDRLDGSGPWGIVLHWYGDDHDFDHSLEGYLRGFNTPRQVAGYITQTSAHALVGSADPASGEASSDSPIAVLQTQIPASDGTPFIASHLQALDYQAHRDRLQYFVRALYELGYKQPTIHSILQDWFDGPRLDANTRSLAIEQAGKEFDTPGYSPTDQQIANMIAVVRAYMLRYALPASSLLGHNEIQIDKPDPGKRFMARMRCLLAAKALVDGEPLMNELVFGQHLSPGKSPVEAVRIYINWVRDYLVLVSRPSQVYAWEAESGYWLLNDLVNTSAMPCAAQFFLPVVGGEVNPEMSFGTPPNHDGVDLWLKDGSSAQDTDIYLIADGKCLYAGEGRGFHLGKQAIFLHRQMDGAEMLSIYENLISLRDLEVGEIFAAGVPIGKISSARTGGKMLHFSVAYRTTWEKYLKYNPDAAYNASPTWVKENYLDPMAFLKLHQAVSK